MKSTHVVKREMKTDQGTICDQAGNTMMLEAGDGDVYMTEDEKTRALDYVEGREVISFLREHFVNSGLYHVGQKLLEKISLNSIKPFESWTNLIRLEKCIRNVSRKSSPFCNLFLAEVYMDMMSSTTGQHEIAGFLEDCDYHLCNIIGYIAVEMSSYDNSAIGLSPEILDKNKNLVREIQIKGAGTESCLWSFWVRFYWASGRLHYLQGTCEKGREDFHKCLEILESREHSEIGADTVILTHCRTDNKISAEYAIRFTKSKFKIYCHIKLQKCWKRAVILR